MIADHGGKDAGQVSSLLHSHPDKKINKLSLRERIWTVDSYPYVFINIKETYFNTVSFWSLIRNKQTLKKYFFLNDKIGNQIKISLIESK